ncbi:MAG TPA: hypothetical protein GYA04_02490, partial [Acholeplasma sp.]|nr:hypothetical protein [Acholeplasma sp.]
MATFLGSKEVSLKSVGGLNNAYKLKLELYLNSQDTTYNRSNVTLKAFMCAYSGWGFSGYSQPKVTGTINGNQKFQNTVSSIMSTSYVEVGSWTGNINHNEDGKLTILATVSFSPNRSDVSYLPASGSVSETKSLPDIPRASICSFPGHQMGDNFRINTNRASSSFTHNLTIYVNNTQILTRSGIGDYVDIIPTPSEKQLMHESSPNNIFATMKVKCETYNGATKIGETNT